MRNLETPSPTIETIDSFVKLTKDLKDASRLLSREESIWLVNAYYRWQDERIAAASRLRLSKDEEPNRLIQWTFDNMQIAENQTKLALNHFVKRYRVGNWLMSICGIGPVIAAGLLAHLDIRGKQYPSSFWRFAGLDPTAIWMKGQKRPWNAALKRLMWLAGESFVKVQANKNDFYGKILVARKQTEWEQNLQGKFAEQATNAITVKKYDKSTTAYLFYSGQISPSFVKELLETEGSIPQGIKATTIGDEKPMLPPAHIHARARRVVQKLFVSHIHQVMHEDYYGVTPPKPYAFDHMEGHHDFIEPPNWPGDHKGDSLQSLFGPPTAKVEA